MQAIQTQILQYVTRHYTVPDPAIQPDHEFRQDLGLNKWELFEILLYLEQLFNVNLPDEVLTRQLTVGQLSRLIYHYAPAVK